MPIFDISFKVMSFIHPIDSKVEEFSLKNGWSKPKMFGKIKVLTIKTSKCTIFEKSLSWK